MNIAFFTNFMNHHQLPLCLALQTIPNVQFTFVATEPVPGERLDMGYHDMNAQFEFILKTYEDDNLQKEALRIARKYDVVIFGNAPEYYLAERISENKLTFRYSERLFKKGYLRLLSPKWFRSKCKKHIAVRNKKVYMLCASAYTAADLSLIRAYPNRMLKWGYFPEVKHYDNIQTLISKKDTASILWVGRLIELKHPDASIQVAKKLKNAGYKFKLDIIGSGELESTLGAMISENGLDDCVHMLGSMSPEQVRQHMEKSEIFLFTSDFNEGWGAVLNESMNSGCAVVASHAIGSVPHLIRDGKNGFIYKNGNIQQLFEKVRWLLEHQNICHQMGEHAYRTLLERWNADEAAKRFVSISSELLCGGDATVFYKDDVCSPAQKISQNWFR